MSTVKHSKRFRSMLEQVDTKKAYLLKDAVEAIKKAPSVKFDETVDLNFQLGIDMKQSDQAVRGMVSLPHGTGKSTRILVFCKGEEAKEAEKAGADYVGADDLIQKVMGGWLEFDVIVAHPDMMRDISKLGKVLGPKGLMPSPKIGTVTKEIGKTVSELKKGKVEFKSDKTGGTHVRVGKKSFEAQALIDNAQAVIRAILDSKPQSAKGVYLENITLSSTMGPGFKLNSNQFAS
jgi:large subunit ribosomal protein L1